MGALQHSDAIELIGVVEPFAATREAIAAGGVATWETVDQLLNDSSPEGVLVAAPSDQHPALVASFSAAGIPVLCEKPVGIEPSDAAAATRSASEAGVRLQVGYWRRFVPALRRLRDRIAAGELGEIRQLSCMQWDAQLPSEQFRRHSGGIAVDMGVHEFDQVRWLLGQEFEWMAATAAGASTKPRDPSDPDCATILARLSAGAAATVLLGRRFPHEDSCWLEIWGVQGYERLPFMWDAAGEVVFTTAMRAQAEAFAAAVRGGPSEGALGADAVAALTVARTAAQSLRGGGAPARPGKAAQR